MSTITPTVGRKVYFQPAQDQQSSNGIIVQRGLPTGGEAVDAEVDQHPV